MVPKLQFLIISIIFCASCQKDLMQYDKFETFDDLTQSISKYSASVESRNVNWDSLSRSYRLLISNEMTEELYFEVIGELLRHFRDPHVWLISDDRSMYTIDFLNYKKNFDRDFVFENYISDAVVHSPSIISGFLQDSIGYLFCADFKGDKASNNQIFKEVISKFKDAHGIVIDLRVNDGGSVYNAQNLLNKITSTRTLWHFTQNRTINGFDAPYAWYIEPDEKVRYNGNVIVLTGRYTISAGERFTIGSKLLENVMVIGDTTANTQGSVMGREMLNGWQFTCTFEKVTDPDGHNYAGTGIPPDYYVSADSVYINNKDMILEMAIQLLDQ